MWLKDDIDGYPIFILHDTPASDFIGIMIKEWYIR
jgi:hypothetical protein